ncbi:MAG: hypothetical protein WCO56_03110 [Verrucomicrobiota bacterium]
MNYRRLLPSLEYRRLVKGVKRNYHVLEAPQHYIIFSPNKHEDAGNYTIVPKKALNFIVKKLGGTKSITTAEVLAACKGSMYFGNHFSALNAMYALIGAKGARVSKISGNKLFFNIWKNGK